MGALSGKVAVVTGASRGIGKGIALALADEGMTVYVTGRTVTPGSYDLPGTVGETAAEVDRRGGKGVAVAVDHAKSAQIAALFDQVRREQGRLDILVNNAFQLPEDLTDPGGFWEKDLDAYMTMLEVGVRNNYACAWHAARMMVPQKSGLIVGISGFAGVSYTYSAAFGTCKSAGDRLAHDMAVELAPHNVASLALWQALTFTERAERNLARTPGMDAAPATLRSGGSSPEFPGRVIAAFAKDPDIMRRSGSTYITAEIALEYGVTDLEGHQPPSMRGSRGAPLWGPVAP
jgi:NAD(P)-dependent dehydrogenase (short-subunit alcohol dehydrogenase family)